MHEKHLYEYAVIRVVPKVEREEFINVGLMLYSKFEKDERFRWISAIKSSSIQTSRPHSGFSVDLDKTFEKLYNELVE